MNAQPDIDVIVLGWNDGDLVERAVRSSLVTEGLHIRVIVVDNDSVDPVAIDLPSVTVIRNPVNRGVAAARNQGARAGRAPVICFLDSDASLVPGALDRLVAKLRSDDSVALVAPVFVDQSPEASAGRAPTLGQKLLRGLNVRNTYRAVAKADAGGWPVDFAIGACQVFRRSAFDQVGGLDEAYFYGPEDVDFCLRLRLAGWRIFQVAGALCEHPPRRRFRGLYTPRGRAHARALARHHWRHRFFRLRVGSP